MSLVKSPGSPFKARQRPPSPTISPKISLDRDQANQEEAGRDEEEFIIQNPSSLPKQTFHALSFFSQPENGIFFFYYFNHIY